MLECLTLSTSVALDSSCLPMCSLRDSKGVQVLGSLPPKWETWTELLASGFRLPRPTGAGIWEMNQQRGKNKIAHSFSPHPTPAFQINKILVSSFSVSLFLKVSLTLTLGTLTYPAVCPHMFKSLLWQWQQKVGWRFFKLEFQLDGMIVKYIKV